MDEWMDGWMDGWMDEWMDGPCIHFKMSNLTKTLDIALSKYFSIETQVS